MHQGESIKTNLIQSEVIRTQTLHQSKWIGLKLVDFRIGDQTIKNYQMAYRTTTKEGCIAGINIIPVIKYKQKQSQICIIANFRPPCGKFVLQFPAGLVQDENFIQNAKRELKEETGLIAYKFVEFPHLINHCDPWKSDESGIIYIALIDGDDQNCMQAQELDNGENIRVYKIPITQQLLDKIIDLSKKQNYGIEGKVYCLSLGILQQKLMFKNK